MSNLEYHYNIYSDEGLSFIILDLETIFKAISFNLEKYHCVNGKIVKSNSLKIINNY